MTWPGTPESGTYKGLHFEAYGEGRPIIALHGLGATLYSWRDLVEPLAAQGRLYLFDLRGHGESERPNDQRYSVTYQAEVILQFIRDFDLENLVLIGHSMGGGIALLVAIRLVESEEKRLSSLVLIDSVAFPKKLPFLFQVLRLPLLGKIILSVLPPAIVARLVLATAFHDPSKITNEMVKHYAENLRAHGGVNALASTIGQMIPSNIGELIRKYDTIRVPTLILWGHDDRLVPLVNGKELAGKIKNSVFEEIPNCGHVPQEEQPALVIGYINAFLQSTRVPECGSDQSASRGVSLEGTRL